MKPSDFKILSTLPDGYEYRLFDDYKGNIMVLGSNGYEPIGFRIINGELRPIKFEVEPKGEQYR